MVQQSPAIAAPRLAHQITAVSSEEQIDQFDLKLLRLLLIRRLSGVAAFAMALTNATLASVSSIWASCTSSEISVPLPGFGLTTRTSSKRPTSSIISLEAQGYSSGGAPSFCRTERMFIEQQSPRWLGQLRFQLGLDLPSPK